MTSQFKLLKKLSTKAVMGNVKAIVKELNDGDVKDLLIVIGVARGTKVGETDNGPWVAFTGSFEATNLITGEVSRSGTLFLPDVASDLVADELDREGVDALEIGFKIGIRVDESSSTGYVYEASPLMAPSQDDPLTRIKSQMVAIEAPKADKAEAQKAEAKK